MGLYIHRQGTPAKDLQLPQQDLTTSGAIAPIGGLVVLNNGAADIAATLTPKQGQIYVFHARAVDTAHTVTITGFTWDGTNDVATFDAAGETLTVMFDDDRAIIISNPASVAFS